MRRQRQGAVWRRAGDHPLPGLQGGQGMHHRNLQMTHALCFIAGIVVGVLGGYVGIIVWVLLHDGAGR
jgi:hypothetical protein